LLAHVVGLLTLAAAVGSASFMVSKSKMFKFLRDWAERRNAWLSGLLICPYCTGTWLSLAAVAVYRPFTVHMWWPADYLVTVLAVNGLAMLPVLIIRTAVGMK